MSGMGSRSQYEGLKVTLMAGSTPAIDGQILVHQDLGTRELIYRTHGSKLKRDVMKKCFDNGKLSKECYDCQFRAKSYLNLKEDNNDNSN